MLTLERAEAASTCTVHEEMGLTDKNYKVSLSVADTSAVNQCLSPNGND